MRFSDILKAKPSLQRPPNPGSLTRTLPRANPGYGNQVSPSLQLPFYKGDLQSKTSITQWTKPMSMYGNQPSRSLSLFTSKEPSQVGRIEAVKFLATFSEGTLGSLVLKAVEPFAQALGDIAAGNIGQHYKDREEALRETITVKRIIEFAETETAWWRTQPGIPGWIGSLMSENMRATILLYKAVELKMIKEEEIPSLYRWPNLARVPMPLVKEPTE